MGILRDNGLGTEGGTAGLLPQSSSIRLDVLDHLGNPLSPGLLGKLPPAGERRECDRLGLGIPEAVVLLPAVPGECSSSGCNTAVQVNAPCGLDPQAHQKFCWDTGLTCSVDGRVQCSCHA